MGYSVNIEIKNKEEVPKYVIFSDNDALLIGKNGKNLKAWTTVVNGYLNTELGRISETEYSIYKGLLNRNF